MKNSFTDAQLRIFEKEHIECDDIVASLGELIDNDLPQSLKARVEWHIMGCAECTNTKATYELTIKLASELKDKPVPEDVRSRLRSNLNRRLGLNLEI